MGINNNSTSNTSTYKYEDFYSLFEVQGQEADTISLGDAQYFVSNAVEAIANIDLTADQKMHYNQLITESDYLNGGDKDGKIDKSELKNVFAQIEYLIKKDIFNDVTPQAPVPAPAPAPAPVPAPVPETVPVVDPKFLDIDVIYHADINKLVTEHGVSLEVAIFLAISVNFDFTKVKKIIDAAGDKAEDLINLSAETLVALAGLSAATLEKLIDAAGDSLEKLGEIAKLSAQEIEKLVKAAGEHLEDLLDTSADKLKKLIATAGNNLEKLIDKAGDDIEKLVGELSKIPQHLSKLVKDLINTVANTSINIEVLFAFLLSINIKK